MALLGGRARSVSLTFVVITGHPVHGLAQLFVVYLP